MNRNASQLRAITRRHFFEQAGFGVGAAALWNLLEGESRASGPQYLTRPVKAKNIIYLPPQQNLWVVWRSKFG